MLEFAIKNFQLRSSKKAECKILLGDIYLSINEVWEASLLYSQVEKDFKYDPLGDEAKFKNARIFFFTGDFNWAKAQFDVLKGSTSKLIANDAMRMSLLISDNLLSDSTGEALKVFGRAMLNSEQKKLDEAKLVLDTMKRIYLAHSIIDEVYYLEYEVLFKQQKFTECTKPLETIVNEFPEEILADEALFKLADVYDNFLENSKKAQGLYRKLIEEYPSSIRVVDARKRFREIRGDDIN